MDEYLQSELIVMSKIYDFLKDDLAAVVVGDATAHKIYEYPPIRGDGAQYVSREIYMLDRDDVNEKILVAYEVFDKETYQSIIRKYNREDKIKFVFSDDKWWAITGLIDFLPSLPLMDIYNYLTRKTKSGRLAYAKKMLLEGISK